MSPKKKVSETTPEIKDIKVESIAEESIPTEIKEGFEPKVVDKSVPFLEVEEVRSLDKSALSIYNANPAYQYRWCAKEKMASGRKDIWHTVPKNHPDFKGLMVEIDHSVDQNFFTYKDLVLCATRVETAAKRRKLLDDKVMTRDRRNKEEQETLIKVSKESMRDGIRTLDKALEDGAKFVTT